VVKNVVSPLVTVITRTYNRAHLLPRAINSVLDQTYQNFELIIIDDCSSDNTEQVVKSYMDERIIYHKNQENMGILVRSVGFDLARGMYGSYLDDDDELTPNALESAVEWLTKLSKQGIKMVWFDTIDAQTGEFCGSGLRKEGHASFQDLLCDRIRGDYWQTWNMELIRNDKQFIQKYGEDRLLWLRLFRQTEAYYVPLALYKAFRQHSSERITDSFNFRLKHLPTWIMIQKKYIDEFGRIFIPDLYRFRIAVLDSKGNEITHFGKYGNMDNGGKGSLRPDVDIPLGWPIASRLAGNRVLIADLNNRRIVSAKTGVSVSKTCAIK